MDREPVQLTWTDLFLALAATALAWLWAGFLFGVY